MAILFNEEDLLWINNFQNEIPYMIKNDTLYSTIIKESFDERTLLPEEIYDLANEIQNSRFINESEENKTVYVSTNLGSKKDKPQNLQHAKHVAKIFEALKNQLSEYETKDKDIFSHGIEMIKKSLGWMENTFKNLKNSDCHKVIIIKQEIEPEHRSGIPWSSYDYADEEYR